MESAHKRERQEQKATLDDALALLQARAFDAVKELVHTSDIDVCTGTAIDAAVPFASSAAFPELIGVSKTSKHLFAVAVQMGHGSSWSDPSLVSLVVAMIESGKVKVSGAC
jgi:hypothetical protein